MLRNIGAFIAGLVVGSICNMALIILNSSVFFPMPEGTDMNDPEQMKAYVATLPATGFVVPLIAHVAQGGVGGWVAARLSGSRPMLLALILGVLTAAGSVYNLIELGGPAWMWIDAPLVVLAAWFAGSAETKRRASAA